MKFIILSFCIPFFFSFIPNGFAKRSPSSKHDSIKAAPFTKVKIKLATYASELLKPRVPDERKGEIRGIVKEALGFSPEAYTQPIELKISANKLGKMIVARDANTKQFIGKILLRYQGRKLLDIRVYPEKNTIKRINANPEKLYKKAKIPLNSSQKRILSYLAQVKEVQNALIGGESIDYWRGEKARLRGEFISAIKESLDFPPVRASKPLTITQRTHLSTISIDVYDPKVPGAALAAINIRMPEGEIESVSTRVFKPDLLYH